MASLEGYVFDVFINPPTHASGLPGIVEAQNVLIEKCLAGDWDYLWLVQADVEVPSDAFERLLSLGVDVAQGVVPRHDDPQALICGFMDESMKVWYLPRKVVEGMILSGWVFAGMSCTLIKRRVLEAGIRFRYQSGVGEDILFLYDVQKAGFVAKVDGRVVCGHLPEWPLSDTRIKDLMLDVGCGHEPKGDVNVDLFPEATPHRSIDQRVCEDAPLDVRSISNFVKAEACHLPFGDGVFSRVYSGQTIEHVEVPERMVRELLRVSKDLVEIVCPHAQAPWGLCEQKPLHVNALTIEWFENLLRTFPNIAYDVRGNRFNEGPGDIFVTVVKRDGFD